MADKEFYPGSHLQSLFNFFSEEHDLILTEGQLNDVIHEVEKISKVEYNQKVCNEDENCQLMINAEWTALTCSCGKRVEVETDLLK